jgi:hypothetical protein
MQETSIPAGFLHLSARRHFKMQCAVQCKLHQNRRDKRCTLAAVEVRMARNYSADSKSQQKVENETAPDTIEIETQPATRRT